MNEERVIFAGFGGQGIMFMSKILSLAAMKEGRNVTWLPSYGAEVRGGTAHCMVKICDKEIASPLVNVADSCIVMNEPSLNKFINRVRDKGLLIINKSLITKRRKRKGIIILELALTKAANSIGNIKVANLVALGAYLKKRKIVSYESIISILKEQLLSKDKSLLDLNIRAFEQGMRLLR